MSQITIHEAAAILLKGGTPDVDTDIAAAAVAIILAVRVTAASLFCRCRRFHHLRVDVVASSSPLWPSPSCYRCRVIATVPLCGIAVTVVTSFSTVTFTITSVSSFSPLFRCPDTFIIVVIAVAITVTITSSFHCCCQRRRQLPVDVVALSMLLSPSPSSLSQHVEKGAAAAEQNSSQFACLCHC